MIKLALIAAPVVALYSPTVVPPKFVTKRLLPDTASPEGPFSPVIKLALIAAPVVALYSPTVGARRARHEEVVARHRESEGFVQPRDKVGADRGSRGGVVFANRFRCLPRRQKAAVGRFRAWPKAQRCRGEVCRGRDA